MFYFILNLVLAITFLLFAVELFRNKEISFVNIGTTFLGIIYVALPLSLLTFLAYDTNNQYSYHLILSIFILVWLSDVGGYFAGINFGKHKLLERISPKKTWEGVVGGLSAMYYRFLHIKSIFPNNEYLHVVI